jgi:hypothetical protein
MSPRSADRTRQKAGEEREKGTVFGSECGVDDRWLFPGTLGEAGGRTDWPIRAWCPKSNQFHLVVETPRPNRVAGSQWLLGVYTHRFKHREKELCQLFSGRYQSIHCHETGR